MNNNFESFKDFLYEAIDYFMIIAIILIVAGIIGWRLDLLFSESDALDTRTKTEITQESKESIDNLKDKNKQVIHDSEDKSKNSGKSKDKEDNKSTTTSDSKVDKKKKNNLENKTITITIPDGANSNSIGDLLKNKGIVDDTSEFVLKSEEMNMSTKLKSGTFEINSDDSLEEVIRTLSK